VKKVKLLVSSILVLSVVSICMIVSAQEATSYYKQWIGPHAEDIGYQKCTDNDKQFYISYTSGPNIKVWYSIQQGGSDVVTPLLIPYSEYRSGTSRASSNGGDCVLYAWREHIVNPSVQISGRWAP